MAHVHSRMNLQFSRLRASLEGQTTLPEVNANGEEKTRADAVPELLMSAGRCVCAD